jgi:dCMP deaminase
VDIDKLLAQAIAVARKSPNRPRKVGAVIVLADNNTRIEACNDFPQGVRDLEDRHGEERLIWMEHAERNAIFAAVKNGLSTNGATILSTYFPCADCARAIVQAGIRRLFTLPADFDDPVWGSAFLRSQVILSEGGVEVIHLRQSLAFVHQLTMNDADLENLFST